MGRLFGLILMVAAIYVGLTLYTEGFDNAFGGIFASSDEPSERQAPVTQRVRDRVTEHLRTGAERRERLAGD
jgi:hypothetical protein